MLTDQALEQELAQHHRVDMPALFGKTNHLPSAVLVPIVWDGSDPWVIATVRASRLREHAGEVCFPGGRPDPEDAGLHATAVREAHEELGIADAVVLGQLSSIPLFTSEYRLHPFVARIVNTEFSINEAEVAQVLRYSLDELCHADVEALPWSHHGQSGLSPVFPLGEHVMFGATAYAMLELVSVAARAVGRRPPALVVAKELTWADVLPAGITIPSPSTN